MPRSLSARVAVTFTLLSLVSARAAAQEPAPPPTPTELPAPPPAPPEGEEKPAPPPPAPAAAPPPAAAAALAKPAAPAATIKERLRVELGPVHLAPIVLVQAQLTPYVGDDAFYLAGDIAERPGFRLRRARVGMRGDVADEIGFGVSVEVGANDDGAARVHEAWAGYVGMPELSVVAGALPVPYSRSAMTGAGDGALIERPFAVRAMAPMNQVGAALRGRFRKGLVTYDAGMFNGFQRTPQFYSGYTENFAAFGNRFDGLAFAGRVGTEPMGEIGPTIQDLDKGPVRVAVGGGYFYSAGGARTLHGVGADALLHVAGVHFLAEILWSRSQPEAVPTQPTAQIADVDSFGLVGELGYMIIKSRFGLSARVELIDSNGEIDDEADQLALTGGASLHLVEDILRVQAEVTHREERHGVPLANDAVTLQLQLDRDRMKPARPLAALVLAVVALHVGASCNQGPTLRAKVIENRFELVGGPVAMADVGDFLLENDRIKVAILGGHDSPGPGVFGGSIVDMDVKRPILGTESGQGHDRFAESFPTANLIVPDPAQTDVRVLSDGSDGREAVIRVEGDGEFLFEAIGILREQQDILSLFFPDLKTSFRFRTDYALHPGERFVTIRTTILLPDQPPVGCPSIAGCPACDLAHAGDGNGCLACECSGILQLDAYTEPGSVFGGILGQPTDDAALPGATKTGIIAGDFVFFGNQNDVFAPGPGFDEDAAVQGAALEGRNSFTKPLPFDFVAAAGGDVSYGYFVKTPDGAAAPSIVNVPLFASAATAFLAAGKSCLWDTSDDASCDAYRAFSFERFLVVGEGDVASVTDEMYRVRGTPTGSVTGYVTWQSTGEAAPKSQLFVFADPDPKRVWGSVEEIVRANEDLRGDVGLVNAIDADLGLDNQLDGDFHGTLPAGSYVIVARDPAGTAVSVPVAIQVRAGEEVVLAPTLPLPATIRYRVTDQAGFPIPAKLALIALDASGAALDGDGRRRIYMGDGRLANGVHTIELTANGEGEWHVEPGRYRVVVSRGIEYGVWREEMVELAPGSVHRVEAVLVHEVDTSGWMSADMHLHSRPSFDSGMALERRVTAVAAEGVELAVSTDHDVHTDYRPAVQALGLETTLATAVGAEITTLEQGHFIGFPFRYDELTVPSHGAHDWTCQGGDEILAAIRALGEPEGPAPLAIVCHPRDGFFGYIDQLGVDGFTLTRTTPLLEENNPVFRTAGCDFDAMEIINGKRFDLDRTATVGESADYNRCVARVVAATDAAAVAAACPEMPGVIPACGAGERLADCRRRARSKVAWATTKRILQRTPEEQEKSWLFPLTQEESQGLCDPAFLGDAPVPPDLVDQPCAYRPGQIDDMFRYLEHGMLHAHIASSDSHDSGKEPGYPRTYFASATDSPSALAIGDAVESLRAAHAFATYGPFVRATIGGKSFGEVVPASAGQSVEVLLDIQTASWFGVDRVELYMNGLLRRVIEPKEPPTAIVDVHGKWTLTVPDRDSWVVIVAMGLEDRNLLSPVALEVPFGDVQLSKLASDAFAEIPIVNTVFGASPSVPDWSPIPPYAVTNPIYLDVDGNGRYDAPLPAPEFCSKPCVAGAAAQCPPNQSCLKDEGVCGFVIPGRCDHRRPALAAP